MGRVTGSWERPIQGVSQQADKDRLNGQCTLQENFIPSPLNGLIKRIGTVHINKLMGSVHKDSMWYSYNRGDDESYIIVIEPNSNPRVFDFNGIEKTVEIKGGSPSYYKVSNPKIDLTLKTIADYTFIVNEKAIVKKLSDKTPMNPNLAIIYCQYATYGRDYIINVDGVEMAKVTTPTGEVAEHITQVRTNYIIEQLASQIKGKQKSSEKHKVRITSDTQSSSTYYVDLTAEPESIVSVKNLSTGSFITGNIQAGSNRITLAHGGYANTEVQVTYVKVGAPPTGYTAEVHGNTMYLRRADSGSFKVTTVDSADGNDLVAIKDKVRQLSNLPHYAPVNYVVKVQNKEGFDDNSYWLKAEPVKRGDDAGSGVRWVESMEQGTAYKFDKTTMPHVLISETDNKFVLDVGAWADRQVGNELTNPFPSFVDESIQSAGTFHNRMMFTSRESAIFSRTNHFFDFFRDTTQIESDDDPVDAFADTDEINNLLHHAVLDGDLVFFAENGQFLISGDKSITKSSIMFKKVTSYPLNPECKPAITGESIMFSFQSGKFGGIREMFTDSFTDTKRARPITEHVSEYIEGTVTDLIASPNINTLLIKTDKNDSFYVYDWLWSGDNKVQAAFHKWKFDGKALYAKFIGDSLYLVIDRDTGVYLELVPISSDSPMGGMDFPVRLDQRNTSMATYNQLTHRWEWTINYSIVDEDKFEFVRAGGSWEADIGTSVIFGSDGDTYYSYDDLGDWKKGATCKLVFGRRFTSRYIPTQPFLKDQNGRVLGLDRFTLGRATLNYESIGNTTIYVRDLHSRREWKYEYNGRMMGGWNNRVGFAPLDGGKFTFPLRLPNDRVQFEVVTEDYRPFILRDMEWEGSYKQRGKRY